MATIDLGKIKQVFRGTYNNATAYVPDDLVVFTDGSVTSTYICTTATTGNNPSSGGTAHANWAFVAKGQATSPTTTQGDLIVRGASADERLAIGAAGKALLVNASGNGLEYGGAGITMAQMWRLTSNFGITSNSGGADITSNLEITDTYGTGSLGSDMSQSSGVFTFPSTGIYLILFNAGHTTSSAIDWSQIEIRVTTNNSNYEKAAYGYATLQGNQGYQTSQAQFMFDVTNTSTHKVKFGVQGSNSNSQLVGSSNQNHTTFTFIRLGDT